MNKMKRLLIFTYYWPPGATPGTLRMLKACKYLPEFGWQPYVVTVKDGSYPSIDQSLLRKIPHNMKVFHTPSLEPYRIYNIISGKKGKLSPVGMSNIKDSKSLLQKISLWVRANIFVPDARIGWLPFAIKKGSELIVKEKIDAILTTGPPHSTHLVGLKLKEKFGLRWLADFRDPWTNIYYNYFLPRTVFSKIRDKKLEQKVVKSADYITTVSEDLKKEYINQNPNIKVVYNGFDKADFKQDFIYSKNNKFKITFFGNLDPSRDISVLWDSLIELVSENDEFAEKLELAFFGNIHEIILKRLKSTVLKNNVKKYPYLAHHEALLQIQKTELLLLIINDTKDNHHILTSKIFEYLASGSPLISVGPVNGNAAKVLSETKRDRMIDYEDKTNMKRQILRYFQIWNSEESYPRFDIDQATMFYSRERQTERLADVLGEMKNH